MKSFLLALALLAGPVARGQMVALWPTNYSQTVTVQNNLGQIFGSWPNDSRDTVVLSENVLLFTHTVYFAAPYLGSKLGAPKQLETRDYYSWMGGYYRPLFGEHITFYAQKAAGPGWIASTNIVLASEMENIVWFPGMIGSVTAGDGFRRTITTGSPLVCVGRNLAGSPQLVRFWCAGARSFDYDFRFEKDQTKLITLAIGPANALLNGSLIRYLTFDWDAITVEPTL